MKRTLTNASITIVTMVLPVIIFMAPTNVFVLKATMAGIAATILTIVPQVSEGVISGVDDKTQFQVPILGFFP